MHGPNPPIPSAFSAGALRFALSSRYRSTRVLGLLSGVLLLSLADLYMTLLHLRSFGMSEANPLARAIIEHGSPGGLILWKLCTVALAVGILFYARKRAFAEWASIFCCGVLFWLTLQWVSYNAQVSSYTRDLNSLAASPSDPSWVSLSP